MKILKSDRVAGEVWPRWLQRRVDDQLCKSANRFRVVPVRKYEYLMSSVGGGICEIQRAVGPSSVCAGKSGLGQ